MGGAPFIIRSLPLTNNNNWGGAAPKYASPLRLWAVNARKVVAERSQGPRPYSLYFQSIYNGYSYCPSASLGIFVIFVSTLQIATVGKDPEGIVTGIREFSVTKLVLLYTPAEIEYSHDLAQRIAPLRLDIERHIIKDDPLIGTLREVTRVLRDEGPKFDEVLVNISSGSRLMVISTLCAAYINGARAIYISGRDIIELPILKFGYSEQLSESKMGILAAIEAAGGDVKSLSALSKSSNVEKSLLSYHLRGGRDTKGLEELGLVAINRLSQGRLGIELTPIGKLILMGRET